MSFMYMCVHVYVFKLSIQGKIHMRGGGSGGEERIWYLNNKWIRIEVEELGDRDSMQ